MILENEKAPDFRLKGIDEEGKEIEISLNDLLKHKMPIILYFYPKDNTPGCTKEACDFRNNMNRLVNKALVVGISADSLESHKRFKEKQGLNFILLSDKDKTVINAYGAWGKKMICAKLCSGIIRSTFLIDKTGIVKKVWSPVKVNGHVDQIIQELENL